MALTDAWPEAAVAALRRTWVAAPEFGLVLGAGVTIDSLVPGYEALARRLLERAAVRGLLVDTVSPDWVAAFSSGSTGPIAYRPTSWSSSCATTCVPEPFRSTRSTGAGC